MDRSFGTHDGTFHADEVTACALLLLFDLIDRDKIVRTRDEKRLEGCDFVCDVGLIYNPKKRRFDHHQSDYAGKMSSAGMILLYLEDQKIITSKLRDFFNHTLILGVDAHDTGQIEPQDGICTFSLIVAGYVPVDYSSTEKEKNLGFFQALDFVYGVLERLLKRFRYLESSKEAVKKAMEEGGDLLIFKGPLPWLENFFELGGKEHPGRFVLMPSGGHWKLRGIPPDLEHRMQVRTPLPEEWAGLSNQELEVASGIKGAVFCHKGRFISIWETKEAALKAYERMKL